MNDKAVTAFVRERKPMDEAADLLCDLCDRVDSGEELTTAFVAIFKDAKMDLVQAVDRRIAFDTEIKGAIALAKKARDDYAARAKRLEMLHEAFKAQTKLILETRDGVTFVGTLGRIRLQNNSSPKLKLAFFDKDLTKDMINTFGISPEYIKTEVTYSIDNAKVKADLLAGKDIPWAALDHGQHVRFGS